MNLLIFGQDKDGADKVIGAIDADNPAYPALAGLMVINMLRTGAGVYVPQSGNISGGAALLSSTPAPATGVLAGTTAMAVGAAQLPNNAGRGIMLYNDNTSGINIFIGSQTSQPIKLLPGDSWGADLANLNLLWARSASGAPLLAWMVLT